MHIRAKNLGAINDKRLQKNPKIDFSDVGNFAEFYDVIFLDFSFRYF